MSVVQVARGRAIIPANRKHLELEPTIIGVIISTDDAPDRRDFAWTAAAVYGSDARKAVAHS